MKFLSPDEVDKELEKRIINKINKRLILYKKTGDIPLDDIPVSLYKWV